MTTCARRPRSCCTTISTAVCARRRSSSWPPRPATTRLPASEAEALGTWFRESADSGSLPRYLETFDHTLAVMQTREGLFRVASECAQDLAADGVVYAESRYAPEQHLTRGLTLEGVVEAVNAGLRDGEAKAAAASHPIRVTSLLTAMRHAAKSTEIAELAIRYRDQGVSGFDIAGAEAGYPPTRHLDAFEYLRRENFHFTIHAGEAFGLPSIWEAIQWCGADRLGHGVRIVDDITIDGSPFAEWVEGNQDDPAALTSLELDRVRLGRLAAYVRDKRIPLEMCPSSNLQTVGGPVHRAAPDHAAAPTALPRHPQHRQPPHERHVDDEGGHAAARRGRLDPRGPALGDDQRDEVGLHPLRRAPRAHRRRHQAGVCRSRLLTHPPVTRAPL